jgi:23S rRNA (adenine2503-C2)-methyltransferase
MQLCSLTYPQLKEWALSKKLPAYIPSQIFDWVYKKKVLDFALMTNIKKETQNLFLENFSFPSLEFKEQLLSKDGQTEKFLFQLKENEYIESVLILSDDRATICVSSQLGCPVGCSFCASGKLGFTRNLEVFEIIEQILQVSSFAEKKGVKISNIVFMGMGEPLLNFENVKKTLLLLQDEKGMDFSSRRTTISTVGIIEGIYRLADLGWGGNLALSLHSAIQEKREKLIPAAKINPLPEIFLALETYFEKTKRDITLEYILIEGVNDQEEDLLALTDLLKGRSHFSLNLIPYNPVPGLNGKRPDKEVIENFRWNLLKEGIPTTWRYTKGVDIAAACGQLALQKQASCKS